MQLHLQCNVRNDQTIRELQQSILVYLQKQIYVVKISL